MFTPMIAKSKLPPGSNWDQVQAGAKDLRTSYAKGLWICRSSTSFFEAMSFSFADDRDALLFQLHYSDLLSTNEEEIGKKFAPALRYVDAYQERRQHLVATTGEEAAHEELADQAAVLQDLLEQAEVFGRQSELDAMSGSRSTPGAARSCIPAEGITT